MTTPATHPDCDEELMRKIAEGDAEAFDELFTRYGDRAYQVAVAACEDYELAVDAVRGAFMTCWKTSTTYAQRGSVPAWLLATVRQRAVDAGRRRALECASPVAGDGGAETQSVLAKIPEPIRAVIELAYFGQLTETEIAAQLALAPAATATRMRLGLSKLVTHPEAPMSQAR